ncbi:UNVERIFIED_CONTAM: E3 ubiquitin-protein ligase UPL2, partial [Sesamum radiatum]
MSLADTDVEDHDDAGLGDEYNDDMVDEEDDDFHENRVIEVRWREALDGLDHLQVLGQPGTGGGLIDVSAEAFEGVNVDDFFGIRRSFGFERRRQANRTSYERSVTEGMAVEEQFISQLSNNVPAERLSQNPGLAERQEGDPILAIDNQLALGVDNADVQLNDAQNINNDQQVNELAEVQSQDVNTEVGGQQLGEGQQAMEDVPCEVDNNSMGTRDRNAIDSQLLRQLQDPLLRMRSHYHNKIVCLVKKQAKTNESGLNNEAPNANGIDPTFLEALPEDLRAEVLASQQARSAPAPTYAPPTVEDIDPEFLAALPPDIQAEVLAQQRAQRIAQQSEGQPVDMDNASIIATFPAELREEADSNGQGCRVTIGRRASSIAENLKLKELEGEPLLDANGLKALIRLLRLAQRLLLNLCSHNDTRAILVQLLLDMIKPETLAIAGGLTSMNTQRLYGCQSDVVYGRSQLCDGSSTSCATAYVNHSEGKDERVMGLLQVVVYAAASKVDIHSKTEETAPNAETPSGNENTSNAQKEPHVLGVESTQLDQSTCALNSKSDGQRSFGTYDIFLLLPQSDLHNLCALLGHEG